MFFLLALFFNPILGLNGFLVLDIVMDATGSEGLTEAPKNIAQKDKHALQQAGIDYERAAASTGVDSQRSAATGSDPKRSPSRPKGDLENEPVNSEMTEEPGEGTVQCEV